MGRCGGGGKGRPQHRRYWGAGKGGRNGGHGKRGGNSRRHVEFDIDEVCNGLGELQTLAEPVEAAAKLCGQLCSQAFDAFMETCSEGAEERERLQSALEGGFPCFPKSQRNKLREKLAPHGFELDDAGHSDEYSRPERGSTKRRKGGRADRARADRARPDRARPERARPERAGQGKKGSRRAREDEIKARQPWNQVGKDGLTGANSIKVTWKQPKVEDAANDGDSSTEGVSAKAMPVKPPPSPVRGPVGRGRDQTRPAWMSQGGVPAAPPALADSAATPAKPSRSPVRGAVGHGRGSVVPPWKKQGSDPPSPSIPKGRDNGDSTAVKVERVKVEREPVADARESAADPFGSAWKDSIKKEPQWDSIKKEPQWKDSEKESWKDSEREPQWKEDDSGWGTAQGGRSGHKNRRSRSRSRRRGGGNDDWKSSRDNGHADWSKDDSWSQDGGWGQSQGSKWGKTSWGGRWQAGNGWQEARQEPRQDWEEEVLVCSIHNKKRCWDKLVQAQGPDKTWVCRPGVECDIHVGGSKASKDFAQHEKGAGREKMPSDPKADPAHRSRRSHDRSHRDDHRQAGPYGHHYDQRGGAAAGRTASAGGTGKAPPPPPPAQQPQWPSQALPMHHPAMMSPFVMGPPAAFPAMCGGYAPPMPVLPQMHPASSVLMTPTLPAAALHSAGSSAPTLSSHVTIDAEDL